MRGTPFARYNPGGQTQAQTQAHGQPGPHGPHGTQQEPLIVVEESNLPEEVEPESSETFSNRASLDIDSPVNPYLLSPWRDPREARKHSLPTQQVTDGITASQVRRLSERGGENSGPSPNEAAFLATLSQAPAPSGRRHSVVTISKVPTTIFSRSRRESVAAYPSTNGYVVFQRSLIWCMPYLAIDICFIEKISLCWQLYVRHVDISDTVILLNRDLVDV